MPRLLLTDRFVTKRHAPATREKYFDTKAPGLVLRVTPTGATSWAFTYRIDGKPTQWLSLGTTDARDLADARREALALYRLVTIEHRDPIAERHAAALEADRAANAPPAPVEKPYTFGDFVPSFLEFQKGRKKTWYEDAQKIEKDLLPAWRDLPLRSITRRHVHEILDAVSGRGVTIGVNRLQAVISRIFTVALNRSLVDSHPAARVIKRIVELPGERVLSDAELRHLWSGLEARPGDASDAIKLRLLLAQRGAETTFLRWSEIDLEARIWELPRTRTKNRRPHVLWLPPTALAILQRRAAARQPDDVRVFRSTLHSDDHRALADVHGGAYEWKDLRRTASTRIAGLGFDETTIDRVLNHVRGVTGHHYNKHQYLPEITAALEAWDTELSRILRNEPKAKKADVVAFRRA